MSEEGQLARQFGIIVSGGADVRRNTRKLATLGPGDFFGEMALILRRPASATVILNQASTVLVMHARDFDVVMDAFPRLWRKLAVGLAERLLEADRKLAI
jgi:CRP-like cAMP-binding protein